MGGVGLLVYYRKKVRLSTIKRRILPKDSGEKINETQRETRRGASLVPALGSGEKIQNSFDVGLDIFREFRAAGAEHSDLIADAVLDKIGDAVI